MKFEKFLKSLGGHGIIYTKGDERWLASTSVYAKIPDNITGVIAEKIVPMPEAVAKIIDASWQTDPCKLVKAVMPVANGAIKDCVRIYATENSSVRIPIDNPDYSLIDRSDLTESQSKYNHDTESFEAQALVIKAYTINTDDDPEVIGLIFPITDFNEN